MGWLMTKLTFEKRTLISELTLLEEMIQNIIHIYNILLEYIPSSPFGTPKRHPNDKLLMKNETINT